MTTHARGPKLTLVHSRREIEAGDNFDPVPVTDPLEARFRELLRALEGRRWPDYPPDDGGEAA
jgi:hypothetical protein